MDWLKKPMPSSDIVTKVLLADDFLGILNLSFKTLLLEITGLLPAQHTVDKNNHKDVIS